MNSFLQFENIRKSFFGVEVLKGITLALKKGHTLGLAGENGAGKSTLMNLLGGNLQPDSGTMRLNGHRYAPESPNDAADAGIAFIHQELNLFSNLSVAENLFLAAFPTKAGFISRRGLNSRAKQLLEAVGLDVPPNTALEKLTPGEKQLVEVARALGGKASLIILDEPTTSLSSREIPRLFKLLRRLQSQGVTMIYISHVLRDVLEMSHDIAVLRDGALVASDRTQAFTIDSLIRHMVGRELEGSFPPTAPAPEPTSTLSVSELSQPGIIDNITFNLHRGEILGVAGLMGSGRTELARILFGLDPCANGSIRLEDRDATRLSTRQRIAAGMAFLTEDRRREGLLMDAAIDENIDLAQLPLACSHLGLWVNRAAVRENVRIASQSVKLDRAVSPRQPARTLSGGNQQKTVLAKWLLTQPAVFILDEPTRGIDVGAKFEIYRLIQELAAEGRAFLVISSEIEELLGVCHRILVMRRGEITDELRRDEFDQERILRAALSESKTTAPAES